MPNHLAPAIALQLAALAALSADPSGFRVLLRFPVTDTTALFERALGGDLLVQVRREVDAYGAPGGWYLTVVRRPAQPDSPNLLYHSRSWHGPYPTDVFAWIHAQQYFPDERFLPVYGYPYELRVRCDGCLTARAGP